jgi:hypothetical protein
LKKFITNGHKLISRLDRDIGVLIDNCLGFLYSMDLVADIQEEIAKIEAALYDMVYYGRTQAGYEFKEALFRHRILPIMKRLSPPGYYFGIDPEENNLLGYWRQEAPLVDHPVHEPTVPAEGQQPQPIESPLSD